MLLAGADDPRLVWVGYPDVAAPDRFAVADEAMGLIYMYVPLDLACRWHAEQNRLADAGGSADQRTLVLQFHRTEQDDLRLARTRDSYTARAARSLDLWDHTPKGGIRQEKK